MASAVRCKPTTRAWPVFSVAPHRRHDGEALLAQLKVARAAKQFAETQVAVRNKRAHAARLGERQRLAVVSLAALGTQLLRMGRDVAEQVERMGPKP